MLAGFDIVWQQRAAMLNGLLTTIEIAVVAAMLAIILGTIIFTGLISRKRFVYWLAAGPVDLMRCVPFMLFCYLLYYGLPYTGITLNNFVVGVVSLAIYHASYMAELLRGAWKELPKDSVEAGIAFGFRGFGLLRIVLPPVVIAVLPTLASAFIQIIKDSAFLVIIAVQELTYAANDIQSTYYVPFASFVTAVMLYWFLCLAVEAGVHVLSRRTNPRR